MTWPGYLSETDLTECWAGVDAAPFAGQSILVTGAAGCLGGALAEALLWQRRQGTRLEVIASGRNGAALARRFGALDARLLTWDIGQPLAALPLATMAVHAASPASPKAYLAKPVDTLRANVVGLDALAAHLAPRHGRLLYISSGEIYGSPDGADVPTPESHVAATDPLAPRACYTEAKRHGEALCMAYHRQHGLPVVIARPIHIYGPGLRPDDGRVICDFVAKASAGQAIVMLSDGSARRSFCYLSDAVRLSLLLLSQGKGGEAYNVGSAAPEVSIAELARTVCAVLGQVPITFGEAGHTAGSPMRSCPSMRKAELSWGYRPLVPIEEGIRRLARSFQEHHYAD
jgi:nucleoside-diphosphate-sugar epimerase